ncbi:3-phosphoshikimate 1-carboxyvinyltransferase [Nanoarchaeota archaeon]
MKLVVKNTDELMGDVIVPASKSHTIRAVVFASLADGISILKNPLDSADTKAAVNGCVKLGAKIELNEGEWKVEGFNGKPKQPSEDIDVMNSGTTTNLLTSVCALGDFKIVIDGDSSIRKRPVQPLLDAINNLGASAKSINDNGCPPIEIEGPLKGGRTNVECKSSQYVSSLLITCPLIENDTEIVVDEICEEPYIAMTLKWLDERGIKYENNDFINIKIIGGQKYKAFEKVIPSDWSSAAFPLVAAAITKSNVLVKGLDINDSQGDKQIIDYLKKMGADIRIEDDGIRVVGKDLEGCELFLNKTPDALPAVSILGCFAKGKTIIKNVAHARIKETDRIKVMYEELKKMGAEIVEMEDGLEISESKLVGCNVEGHHDHRVVMALSLAGLIATGETIISTGEAVNVTFPGYVGLMKSLNANIEVVDE